MKLEQEREAREMATMMNRPQIVFLGDVKKNRKNQKETKQSSVKYTKPIIQRPISTAATVIPKPPRLVDYSIDSYVKKPIVIDLTL